MDDEGNAVIAYSGKPSGGGPFAVSAVRSSGGVFGPAEILSPDADLGSFGRVSVAVGGRVAQVAYADGDALQLSRAAQP